MESEMIERITFDGPVILGAGLAGLSAALAAKTALVLSPTPLATGCSNSQSSWSASCASATSPQKAAMNSSSCRLACHMSA